MTTKKYRLCVVIPAGRKRYLEILVPHIIRQKKIIDELRLWVNTDNKEDIDYMLKLKKIYPDFITLEFIQNPFNFNIWTIHNFWKNAIEVNTVYIRLDDDIVWMEENYLEKMYNFRIQNPEYFLISGNVVNNALCDHLHQKNNIYPPKPNFSFYCMDDNSWKNPSLAEKKHEVLLHNIEKNNINQYYFDKCELTNYQRFSINSISWFGSEFEKFNGIVGYDEESWVTEVKTKEIEKKCCIYGEALCSHYSFSTQRDHMDNTTCLENYKKLIS